MIDGGKGQLSAVLETLKSYQDLPLDIETQIVALAKQEEEVFRGKFVGGELKFEKIINHSLSKIQCEFHPGYETSSNSEKFKNQLFILNKIKEK